MSVPIGELFDMRAPGEFTVLASVPVVGDVDAVFDCSATQDSSGRGEPAAGQIAGKIKGR